MANICDFYCNSCSIMSSSLSPSHVPSYAVRCRQQHTPSTCGNAKPKTTPKPGDLLLIDTAI